MTLRDDIRGHFDNEASRFPVPAGLRATVTAEAARADVVERRTTQWAAAAAVVLAAAIVAGLMAAGALRHSPTTPVGPGPKAYGPTPTVASPTRRATPTPTVASPTRLATPTPFAIPTSASNKYLIEVDPVDSSMGWALLYDLPPGGSQRQFWVSRTGDGGRSWSTPMKVGPQLGPGEGDSGHHIHFVDGNNGFVYGWTSTAFVTHDGGRTWTDSGLPYFLEVVAVTGRSPWTWAVTYPCAKGAPFSMPCSYKANLSRDGGRTWAGSWDLPGGFSPLNVVAFGQGGLLISTFGSGDMYLTSDGGAHWGSVRGRCTGDTFRNYVATSDGKELWQVCSGAFPVLSLASLFVSADGGANWAQRTMVAGAGSAGGIFCPAPGTCVLATDKTAIAVTVDGGKSWTPVTQPLGFQAMVFASARVAWAITGGAIWASTDGGSSWSPLPALP